MRRSICIIFAAIFASVCLAVPSQAALTNQTSASIQQGKTQGDAIVSTALKYQGVPYVFGGTTPKGFDCSGFVQYVFNRNGKVLPRTADKQFETGVPQGTSQLKPGDVVFFTTYTKGASHCGIYIGQGKFVHASSSKGVTVSLLSESYWKYRYLGARRMVDEKFKV